MSDPLWVHFPSGAKSRALDCGGGGSLETRILTWQPKSLRGLQKGLPYYVSIETFPLPLPRWLKAAYKDRFSKSPQD